MKQRKSHKPTAAVAGAGIVGICTALQLIRAGYEVTLFDPQPPAKQTSFGNAAYLAAEFSDPLATLANIYTAIALSFSQRSAFKVTTDHLPGFMPWALRFINAARPSRAERSRHAIRLLNAHVVEAWQDLLEFSDARNMMHNSGALTLWERDDTLSDARNMQQSMREAGFETQLFSGPALQELEPALNPQLHHGLLYSGAWQLTDPYAVSMALFNCFKQHGGRFQQQAVSKLIPETGSVKIQTTTEQHYFDQAIVASGAWSKALLKSLGLSAPLAAERGYHLTLPDASCRPSHILGSADRHVVLSSLDSGLRIVGFGEYGRLNSKPNAQRYRQLMRHLQALIRGIDPDQQSISTWMGIRPTLPDSLPVIDLHPKHPQIGCVFGHHHLGVTQAAVSARMITAMLTEGKTAKALLPFKGHLSAYAVDRFGWV